MMIVEVSVCDRLVKSEDFGLCVEHVITLLKVIPRTRSMVVVK